MHEVQSQLVVWNHDGRLHLSESSLEQLERALARPAWLEHVQHVIGGTPDAFQGERTRVQLKWVHRKRLEDMNFEACTR